MDIIREFAVTPEKILNYWCTWTTQSTIKHNRTFKKLYTNGVTRDSLCEEFLFGELNTLDMMPREVRGELIALLDDGWDVPYGAGQAHRWNFGSFELNPDRFPSFHGTPAKRLKEISDRVKALGWYGLGLWQAVQMCTDDGRAYTLDEARAFWRERLSWCAYADVKYLKLDWGRDCQNAEFRRMIRDEAAVIAPDMIIEQANPRDCLDLRYAERDGAAYALTKQRIADYLPLGDTFRVYDATWHFLHTTLISRTAEALEIAAARGDTPNPVLNVEDGVYIGAVLGCSMGIMRCYPCEVDPANDCYHIIETPTNPVIRALKFQRIAPPFGIAGSENHVSAEILHDSYYFPKTDNPGWPKISDQLVVQDCSAAIARGLPLPTVGHAAYGEKPVVLCAKNPRTGVSSVYSAPRTIGGSCCYSVRADITVHGCDAAKPVGIFGHYQSLTLEFDADMTGRRIFGQDLLTDEAEELTDRVTITGNSVTLAGELIDAVGLSRPECAADQPGMVLLAR